jgi:hypothetical protein
MGMDMYLEAKRCIAPSDVQTEAMRRAIGAAIDFMPPRVKPGDDASLLEVSGVTVRVGYWRKFGALHRWFLDKAQQGSNDCRPTYVDDRCLQSLQLACEQVIDDPVSVTESFNVADGEWGPEELGYTQDILTHAITLQQQGWDIYYRASW